MRYFFFAAAPCSTYVKQWEYIVPGYPMFLVENRNRCFVFLSIVLLVGILLLWRWGLFSVARLKHFVYYDAAIHEITKPARSQFFSASKNATVVIQVAGRVGLRIICH